MVVEGREVNNVVAYTRVSTDGQVGDDKFGLEAQRQQIEDYCKLMGLNIVRWYDDEGESGAKRRPGFEEIIYGSESNPPIQGVVVAKSDRVARDLNIYFYYYSKLLMEKDMLLISVQEDFGQFGAFSGVIRAFVATMAQMERDSITARTSAGRKVKAQKGGYAGGKAPTGYKVVNGKLAINEKEAKLVRRVFELRKAGTVLLKIVDIVNEEGYTGRNGRELKLSTIQGILNNEKTYRGYYRYGKDGEWVKGQQEPILTGEDTAEDPTKAENK